MIGTKVRGFKTHENISLDVLLPENNTYRQLEECINLEFVRGKVLIEMWRKEYNNIRPHSSLGYRPPVPEAVVLQSAQTQLVGLTS